MTGNLLALNLTIENKSILYKRTTKSRYIFLVGDFNLVLDPEKDYFNFSHINNPKARNEVLELIADYNFKDIFRDRYPEEKRYKWRKPSL